MGFQEKPHARYFTFLVIPSSLSSLKTGRQRQKSGTSEELMNGHSEKLSNNKARLCDSFKVKPWAPDRENWSDKAPTE